MTFKTLQVNDLHIFYREAGDPAKETILFLHGLPSSSHMYRDVMARLSDRYHVIAPDYPGFGLSSLVPVTFDRIAEVMLQFADKIGLEAAYFYMQDYGGPVGFRMASARPGLVKGLIIQNANAYMEGLGEFPMQLAEHQQKNDMAAVEAMKQYLFSFDGIRDQYVHGMKDPRKIAPDAYLSDHYFMQREGVLNIQYGLFDNYGSNFLLYPQWQQYFREHQPPALVTWGKNDPFFTVEGAKAYARDLQHIALHFFDSGHFLLEDHCPEVAALIDTFIGQQESSM